MVYQYTMLDWLLITIIVGLTGNYIGHKLKRTKHIALTMVVMLAIILSAVILL